MSQPDWREHYPFASHYFDQPEGLRQHYVDTGPTEPGADAGRPMLMLHGNPTWSFYYRHLIDAFRAKHRVVVPDHIGCGLSDKPQDYDYRLEQHIDHAVRLVRALDLKDVTLCVHDWGGPIGFGLAQELPDRITRLVVFNTCAWLSPRIPFRIWVCRIPGFGALAVRGFNAFAGSATWMATSTRLSPSVKAGYLAPYDSWANRIATLRFVEDIPLRPSHPTYDTVAQIEARLPAMKGLPMMVVWGMRDWCFSPHFLAGWRERFPDAEVHELADAHHLVVEDAHERIVPLMTDFLGRHGG